MCIRDRKETAPDANEENRAEQGEEADEPVSTEDSAATADAAENPASSETAAYAVGDTVYLDDTLFVIEAKSAFGVQLRDPSQRYPIFRAESLPRFERLLAADERNAHFLPAAETALRNIVLDLSASASEQREPAPEPPAAENFRITDEHLGEGSAKAKFSANIEAISVLKMVESEHRPASPQEQEVLSRYVGWGGLPQAFDERSEAWHSEYSALKSLLTQEEYEAARASTLNAHYTSPLVIRAIYAAVEQLGFRSGNVLEPSMGVGAFFGHRHSKFDTHNAKLYGVELDSLSGRIAQQLYQKAKIQIAGYEKADLPFAVLYEDEDFLVLDKPYNMPVHPSPGHDRDSVLNAAAWYFQNTPDFVFRPLYRLDRDTTGALVLAKNKFAANAKLTKTYRAVCEGEAPESGCVNVPIGLKPGHKVERCAGIGDEAVTEFQTVKTSGGYSLIDFHLKTGRTHQIRVHMAHLGLSLIHI